MHLHRREPHAALAQLVEHLIRNEGVGSSNLSSGTNVFNELEVFRASKTASKPINGLSTDFFPGYDLPPELSSSGF